MWDKRRRQMASMLGVDGISLTFGHIGSTVLAVLREISLFLGCYAQAQL
jgi:hypothetical protein